MRKRKELSGMRFGKLSVIARTVNGKHGNIQWMCVCDCGNIKIGTGNSLKRGKLKSCGCSQYVRTRNKTGSSTRKNKPERAAYYSAFARCYKNKDTFYPRYGGREIVMSDDWKASIENFLKDMGDKPSPKHQLDRINNDLGYSKENCRWATASENQTNSSQSKYWIVYGKRFNSKREASEELNIPIPAIRYLCNNKFDNGCYSELKYLKE